MARRFDPIYLSERPVGISFEYRLAMRTDLSQKPLMKFFSSRHIRRDCNTALRQRAIDDKIFEANFRKQFFDAGSFFLMIAVFCRSDGRGPQIPGTIPALGQPDSARLFAKMLLMSRDRAFKLCSNIRIVQ